MATPSIKRVPRNAKYGDAPFKFIDEVVLPHQDREACLTWPFSRGGGFYAYIWLDGRRAMATRYVCEKIHGAPPTPRHQAAHSCGKGHEGCINPWHLSWKTPLENQHDRFVHGTHMRGERHPSAKLAEADVRAIRALKGMMTKRQIAEQYGVAMITVKRILNYSLWPHVA